MTKFLKKYGGHFVASLWTVLQAGPSGLSLASTPEKGATKHHPRVGAEIQIQSKESRWQLEGVLNFQDLAGDEVCFFLPGHGFHLDTRQDILPHVRLLRSKFAETLQFTEPAAVTSTQPMEFLTPYLIRVKPAISAVQLRIKLDSIDPPKDDFFFRRIAPVPLNQCPPSVMRISPGDVTYLAYQVKISAPVNWQIVGDIEVSHSLIYRGDDLVFALGKNLKSQFFPLDSQKFADNPNGLTDEETIGGFYVYYRNKSFLALVESIVAVFPGLTQWFGPFPHHQLVFMETAQHINQTLPGIVPINIPQDDVLRSLQTKVLNWNHWATLHLLARQWWGAAVRSGETRDNWIADGLIDYAVGDILRRDGDRYDLFKAQEGGPAALSISYLDAQYITASLLKQAKPALTLVNDHGASNPRSLQHPLHYMRQSLFIRSLVNDWGLQNVQRSSREFTRANLGHSVKPLDFKSGFNSQFKDNHADLKKYQAMVAYWWQSHHWPDYALADWSIHQVGVKSWTTKISVTANHCLPARLSVQLESAGVKQENTIPIDCQDGRIEYVESIQTDFEPERILLDPSRELFDADRFNNTSGLRAIKFMPGSARKIGDDHYTGLWLPYPFKRPAEGFGYGLQLALFRFLDNSLVGGIEHQHDPAKTGYHLNLLVNDVFLDVRAELGLQRNFEGFRSEQIFFNRNVATIFDHSLGASLRLRNKSASREVNSTHQTVAGYLALTPITTSKFGLEVRGEWEETIDHQESPYTYQRRWYDAVLRHSNVFSILHYQLRWFHGTAGSRDDAPDLARFYPKNLDEAHIRSEDGGFPVDEIRAFNGDVFFPTAQLFDRLGFLLVDRMDFRLFYDTALTNGGSHNLWAAGCGLQVPLGGDFIGVGSVAMSRFTLLATLRSSTDGVLNDKPQLIFSMMGDL